MPERFGAQEKAVVPPEKEGRGQGEEIRFSDRELLWRINQYPELKAKIGNLLGIIENAGGDVEKADEAERRIIEELRRMGNEVLQSWASQQQQKKEEEYQARAGMNRKEKKPSTGTRGSDPSR